MLIVLDSSGIEIERVGGDVLVPEPSLTADQDWLNTPELRLELEIQPEVTDDCPHRQRCP